MGCSGAGFVAILVVVVALILNTISISLPVWTTTKFEKEDKTLTADFTAGLWGFCTDATFAEDKEMSFDRCFLFHTDNMSDKEKAELDANRIESTSVCDVYNGLGLKSAELKEKTDAVRNATISGWAEAAGFKTKHFEKFLKKSCGGVGYSTLIFMSIALFTGTLSAIFLTLGITCCKNKSIFVGIGKHTALIAFISTLLTWILWLVQVSPLDSKKIGWSFILSVLASILYIIVFVLASRHAAVRT